MEVLSLDKQVIYEEAARVALNLDCDFCELLDKKTGDIHINGCVLYPWGQLDHITTKVKEDALMMIVMHHAWTIACFNNDVALDVHCDINELRKAAKNVHLDDLLKNKYADKKLRLIEI